MSTAEPRPAAKSSEVLARYEASPDVEKLAATEASPAKLVTLLVNRGLADEAVEFIACWLPPRQAIWWGCLSLWDIYRPAPAPEIDATLGSIVAWVEDPTEANRRRAEIGGKSLSAKHPVGALALATFWTSGSMSAPDLPEVAPPRDLSMQVIAAALNLAVLREPANRRDELFQHFARLGLEVAAQPAHWLLSEVAS